MTTESGLAAANLSLTEAVRQLTDTALDHASTDVLWQVGATAARQLFGAQAAICFEVLGSDRMLFRAADGVEGVVGSVPIPISPDSQAAFIAASERPVLVSDLRAETRFTPGTILLQLGFRSSLSCRVGRDGGLVGIIGVFSAQVSAFADHQAESLAVLAAALDVGLVHQRRMRDLQSRATTDSLTGIDNRATILGELDNQLVGRTRRTLGHVLMIDLDGFKSVNDTRGHDAGDEVLRCVARRIAAVAGPDARVGRLGGDEFLVLVGGEETSTAVRVAERIIGHIEQDIELPGSGVAAVSASIGVVPLAGETSPSDLLRRVDSAMYAAKQSGRGRVNAVNHAIAATTRVHDVEPRPSEQFNLGIVEDAISSATVLLQPLVAVGSLETVACSAIARGPFGSPLHSAGRLFAEAATFGRLVQLETAVKALAFQSPLPRQLGVLVKIDPAVFVDTQAMSQIIEMWRDSPLRNKVFVELSVRSLAGRTAQLIKAVERVRALGWGIALDDFGQSVDTLTALRVAEPEMVKLDMSLVRPEGRHMVSQTLMALTDYRELASPVLVAKGVETPEQEELAAFMGADMMQGYQFGGPFEGALPAGDGSLIRLGTNDASTWESRGAAPIVATKQQLLDLSRYLESHAASADTVVLACLQRAENYTSRTKRQYAALARRFALVGVVGARIPTGSVNGVRHADIPEFSDLAQCWQVIVLSSTSAVALLAEAIDSPNSSRAGMTGRDQRFSYRLTTDRRTVELAARRLLELL